MIPRFELRSKQETRSLIYLTIKMNGQRLKKSTNLNILTSRWDSGKPKNLPENKGIILTLREIENRLLRLEQECYVTNVPLTIDFLQLRINDVITGKIDTKHTLVSLFADFKEKKKDKLRNGSLKTYTTLQNHLINFQEYNKSVLYLEDVNEKLGDRFSSFLLMEYIDKESGKVRTPLQNPTINKMLRTLLSFSNWGFENGYTRSIEWKKIKYIPEVEQTIVALFPEEILQLEKFNPKNEYQEKIKDTFLFACYTGLRYQDLEQVNEDRIKEGVLKIALTQKNHKTTSIPLAKKALAILAKYDWKLPLSTNQYLNRGIKEVAQAAKLDRKIEVVIQKGKNIKTEFVPIHSILSIHDGRKSFITNCLMKGMHQNLVMEMSTHSQYASFKRYISYSSEHKQSQLDAVFK